MAETERPNFDELRTAVQTVAECDAARKVAGQNVMALLANQELDSRTRAIMNFSVAELPHLRVMRDPEEIDSRLVKFETALATPDDAVVVVHPILIGRTPKDTPPQSRFGEVAYRVSERGIPSLRIADSSDEPDWHMDDVYSALFSEQDVHTQDRLDHTQQVLIGRAAIGAYVASERVSLWDAAEIEGMMQAKGVDTGEVARQRFVDSGEDGLKLARRMLRSQLVQSIADQPAFNEQTWNRDYALERLYGQTIAALGVFGLQDEVLPIIENIGKPITKESKTPGIRRVEIHDPHQCFPEGLSQEESERQAAIYQRTNEMLAV